MKQGSTIEFIANNSRFYVDFIEEFAKQHAVNYLKTVYPNIQNENELLEKGDVYSSREEALVRTQGKVVDVDKILEHEETKRFIAEKGITEDYLKKTIFYYARGKQSNLIRVSEDSISLLGLAYSSSCKEKMSDTYQCSLEWCLLSSPYGMNSSDKRTHCSRLKSSRFN